MDVGHKQTRRSLSPKESLEDGKNKPEVASKYKEASSATKKGMKVELDQEPVPDHTELDGMAWGDSENDYPLLKTSVIENSAVLT